MKLFCKPIKIVIVSENQIIEAADNYFSLSELSQIQSFKQRIIYCKNHLGNPIGNGSSRTVFQINDEKVLKLAKNNKGIAQNYNETDRLIQSYNIAPKIFDYSDDDTYIVAEYVLPAKPQDFKECLGMTFDDFCDFVIQISSIYDRSNNHYRKYDTESFEKIIENNKWLYNFYIYMTDYQPPYGDLIRIQNYGMVNRNNKPEIVLLDAGLTEQTYNEYYK